MNHSAAVTLAIRQRSQRTPLASERSRPITMEDRSKIKEALPLQSSVPTDPEMCGLQALIPRQAGIQVQYKTGEGSFGKCVKVMNRKNGHDWSKGTSKRGIVRYLDEILQIPSEACRSLRFGFKSLITLTPIYMYSLMSWRWSKFCRQDVQAGLAR
jgi:hypothetical protein